MQNVTKFLWRDLVLIVYVGPPREALERVGADPDRDHREAILLRTCGKLLVTRRPLAEVLAWAHAVKRTPEGLERGWRPANARGAGGTP